MKHNICERQCEAGCSVKYPDDEECGGVCVGHCKDSMKECKDSADCLTECFQSLVMEDPKKKCEAKHR